MKHMGDDRLRALVSATDLPPIDIRTRHRLDGRVGCDYAVASLRSKITTLEDAHRWRRRAHRRLRHIERRPAWERRPGEIEAIRDVLFALEIVEREIREGA
jgi:hypothetical protein